MSNKVKILRSSVAKQRPTGKEGGELYVNFADNRVGYIDASGAPHDIVPWEGLQFFDLPVDPSETVDITGGSALTIGATWKNYKAANPAAIPSPETIIRFKSMNFLLNPGASGDTDTDWSQLGPTYSWDLGDMQTMGGFSVANSLSKVSQDLENNNGPKFVWASGMCMKVNDPRFEAGVSNILFDKQVQPLHSTWLNHVNAHKDFAIYGDVLYGEPVILTGGMSWGTLLASARGAYIGLADLSTRPEATVEAAYVADINGKVAGDYSYQVGNVVALFKGKHYLRIAGRGNLATDWLEIPTAGAGGGGSVGPNISFVDCTPRDSLPIEQAYAAQIAIAHITPKENVIIRWKGGNYLLTTGTGTAATDWKLIDASTSGGGAKDTLCFRSAATPTSADNDWFGSSAQNLTLDMTSHTGSTLATIAGNRIQFGRSAMVRVDFKLYVQQSLAADATFARIFICTAGVQSGGGKLTPMGQGFDHGDITYSLAADDKTAFTVYGTQFATVATGDEIGIIGGDIRTPQTMPGGGDWPFLVEPFITITEL